MSPRHAAAGLVAALVVLASCALAQNAPAFAPRDESPEEFPSGAGRDEAFYACTACHGFKLIAAQGLTRPQWEESIALMTHKHNMPALSPKEHEVVLNYLETTFPPRTRPGGWQNPFLPR
jgi:mono/diheme cytochrome c family protein